MKKYEKCATNYTFSLVSGCGAVSTGLPLNDKLTSLVHNAKNSTCAMSSMLFLQIESEFLNITAILTIRQL